MSANDRVLINQMIEERRNARAVPLTFDAAFERFASEHALHGFGLSKEEIEAGVIGGADDGGIDGAYVFLGGRLLHEDNEIFQQQSAVSNVEQGSRLTLWLIQAKTSAGFSEVALDKAASTCANLLNMEVDEDTVGVLYTDDLLARFRLFRTALKRLLTRHPTVLIKFSPTRTPGGGRQDREEQRLRHLPHDQPRIRPPPQVTSEHGFPSGADGTMSE